MNDQPSRDRDPVFLMWVDPNERAVDHQGLQYAFCSEQRRERFLANPGLYVSTVRNRAAAKRQGEPLQRHRRWIPRDLPDSAQAEALHLALDAMTGVNGVRAAGTHVAVDYDLRQVTGTKIETRIAGQGPSVRTSPWTRRRRAGPTTWKIPWLPTWPKVVNGMWAAVIEHP